MWRGLRSFSVSVILGAGPGLNNLSKFWGPPRSATGLKTPVRLGILLGMRRENQLSLNLAQGCPSYERCAAPLCPLSPDVDNYIWYPGEPICTWRSSGVKWLPVQRRYSRLAKGSDLCYTIESLRSVQKAGQRRNSRCPKRRASGNLPGYVSPFVKAIPLF